MVFSAVITRSVPNAILIFEALHFNAGDVAKLQVAGPA